MFRRPFITITLNVVQGLRPQHGNEDADDRVFQYQISPELKLLDLKEYISAETGASTASQLFYLHGQILSNNDHTLHDAGIKDLDMLVVHVHNSTQLEQKEMRPAANAEIERVRQQWSNDEDKRRELRRLVPHLADVLEDPIRFRDIWVTMESANLHHAERELDENQNFEDSMNEENQAKILERIREDNIQKQIDDANENYPERTPDFLQHDQR